MEHLNRRSVLRGGLTAAAAVGVGRAMHNTVVGYGQFGLGENLHTQDLARLAADGLVTPRLYTTTIDDYDVELRRGAVRYRREDDWQSVAEDAPTPVGTFAADVAAIQDGDVSFTFHEPTTFFERLRDHRTLPRIVGLLRARAPTPADPTRVASVVGVEPTDGEGLVLGLVDAFRSHSYYDVPRYAAGSVQDNLLFGSVDLRAPFRTTVSFEALDTTRDEVGLFCMEYVRLANRAIVSVPATDQSPPLVGITVRNRRHKHVFNGFASAIRTDGLEIPMTFVDYTYSTLYDDLSLRGVLGEGTNAFGTRHRADTIQW